ncbi:hypothetical protein CTYAZ2_37520 [Comamonas testosteroni]|nr:hypothetical protein CTYAZ2_37520 [Comamonas testosteroni]
MGSFCRLRLKGNAPEAAKTICPQGLKYTGKRTIYR